MGVVFLGGLGPLTPKNNGWCWDRDEGGVNRVRGSVYRWLGVPYNLYRGSDGPLNNIAELGKLHVDKTASLCVY